MRGASLNGLDHEPFDPGSLDLDVDRRCLTDQSEHLGERRNADAGGHTERLKLVVREVGDCSAGETTLTALCAGHGIVMDDDHAITGRVYVQLDPIGAKLDRSREARQRILRLLPRRSAVRDPHRVIMCHSRKTLSAARVSQGR